MRVGASYASKGPTLVMVYMNVLLGKTPLTVVITLLFLGLGGPKPRKLLSMLLSLLLTVNLSQPWIMVV